MRSSIANAVSTSSLTGVSSGMVTRITWQRSGSLSSSTTSVACLRTGPTDTASSSPLAEVRNVIAWPAAGASTMIRSALRPTSRLFTLPSTRMSFIPGTAVATTSSAPVCTSRFEIRFSPLPWSQSSRAASGVSVRPRTPGASSLSSYSRLGRSKAAASPDLPSTSTISTLMPVRAAATASVAVVVVLPTPPLPATMMTREVEQNCASSITPMLREP